MNEYIDFNTKHAEDTGEIVASEVNKAEKNEYQIFSEQYIQQDLNKRQSITIGQTSSWGRTLLNSMKNFSIPKYLAAPYEAGEFIYDKLTNFKATKRELGEFASGMAKTAILRTYAGEAGNKAREQKWGEKDYEIAQILNFERNMEKEFGTEEAWKRYFEKNPEDTLLTIAPMLGLAGKFTKLKTLEKAGTAIDPFNVLVRPLGILKNMPENLHTRALKLSDTLTHERYDRVIKTSVKNDLGMSFKGVEKLTKQIDELGKVKDNIINTATGSGMFTMPVSEMFKGLDDYVETMLKNSSEGATIKPIVEKIKKGILDAEKELKRDVSGLTAREIADKKTRFGKELHEYWGKLVSTSEALPFKKEVVAKIESNLYDYLKILVPDARLGDFPKLSKKIVKDMYPGIKDISLEQINRLQGDLIELKRAIKDEAHSMKVGKFMDFQIGQKTATGTWIGGISGAVLGGEGGMKIGGMIGGTGGFILGTIDSSPRIKMALGRYLDSARAAGILVKPNATLIRLGLYRVNDYQKME